MSINLNLTDPEADTLQNYLIEICRLDIVKPGDDIIINGIAGKLLIQSRMQPQQTTAEAKPKESNIVEFPKKEVPVETTETETEPAADEIQIDPDAAKPIIDLPMGFTHIDVPKVEQVFTLRLAGKSQKEICETAGLSKGAIYDILHFKKRYDGCRKLFAWLKARAVRDGTFKEPPAGHPPFGAPKQQPAPETPAEIQTDGKPVVEILRKVERKNDPTMEQVERVCLLHASGWSFAEIAADVGVSAPTIAGITKCTGVYANCRPLYEWAERQEKLPRPRGDDRPRGSKGSRSGKYVADLTDEQLKQIHKWDLGTGYTRQAIANTMGFSLPTINNICIGQTAKSRFHLRAEAEQELAAEQAKAANTYKAPGLSMEEMGEIVEPKPEPKQEPATPRFLIGQPKAKPKPAPAPRNEAALQKLKDETKSPMERLAEQEEVVEYSNKSNPAFVKGNSTCRTDPLLAIAFQPDSEKEYDRLGVFDVRTVFPNGDLSRSGLVKLVDAVAERFKTTPNKLVARGKSVSITCMEVGAALHEVFVLRQAGRGVQTNSWKFARAVYAALCRIGGLPADFVPNTWEGRFEAAVNGNEINPAYNRVIHIGRALDEWVPKWNQSVLVRQHRLTGPAPRMNFRMRMDAS